MKFIVVLATVTTFTVAGGPARAAPSMNNARGMNNASSLNNGANFNNAYGLNNASGMNNASRLNNAPGLVNAPNMSNANVLVNAYSISDRNRYVNGKRVKAIWFPSDKIFTGAKKGSYIASSSYVDANNQLQVKFSDGVQYTGAGLVNVTLPVILAYDDDTTLTSTVIIAHYDVPTTATAMAPYSGSGSWKAVSGAAVPVAHQFNTYALALWSASSATGTPAWDEFEPGAGFVQGIIRGDGAFVPAPGVATNGSIIVLSTGGTLRKCAYNIGFKPNIDAVPNATDALDYRTRFGGGDMKTAATNMWISCAISMMAGYNAGQGTGSGASALLGFTVTGTPVELVERYGRLGTVVPETDAVFSARSEAIFASVIETGGALRPYVYALLELRHPEISGTDPRDASFVAGAIAQWAGIPNPEAATLTGNALFLIKSSCRHSVSVAGAPLHKGCNYCTNYVVAADPYCGSTQWDSVCVAAATTGAYAALCGGQRNAYNP